MAIGSGSQSGGSLNSDINVTPLVDVMLVVLIIFMLVTPMLQKGVGVNLPDARNVNAVSEDKSQILIVTLDEDGRTFVGDDQVDRASLRADLKVRHDTNPALQLQIKADRAVRYGEVKKVYQAGRDAGFRDASLIAREVKAQGGQQAAAAQPGG